jgi:hypothetical protein
MLTSEQQDAFNSLKHDWDLATADTVSEEEIIRLLSTRVLYYLEREAEPFFQLMYRLDISERKMEEALKSADPPRSLAELIYERQLQKIKSRKEFKPGATRDKDLGW